MEKVEKRETLRFPTDLEADCRMVGETWAARLCNISTAGCMMTTPDTGLPSGWMLRLHVESLPTIDAEIIWRQRGQIGLRFLTPLKANALEPFGFGLPEPHRPAAYEAGSLSARLVKRMLPEEGLTVVTGAEVRGAPQHVA
jgi:hypothetical protein